MSEPNDYQVGGNHYKNTKYQHWDFVIDNKIPYMEAQVLRYVTRWRHKDGVEALYKAKHFVHKMKERLEDLPGGARTSMASVEGFIKDNNLSKMEFQIVHTLCIHMLTRSDSTLELLEIELNELIEEAKATEPQGRGYVDQGQ